MGCRAVLPTLYELSPSPKAMEDKTGDRLFRLLQLARLFTFYLPSAIHLAITQPLEKKSFFFVGTLARFAGCGYIPLFPSSALE